MGRKNWTDASIAKPKYYQLCWLDIGSRKPMAGWWTGIHWDGLNYQGDEVKSWKYQGVC